MAVKRDGRRGQLVLVKRDGRKGGGVQLVVFGKISSQEIYCSQPLFYLTVKLARLEVKGDESGRPV